MSNNLSEMSDLITDMTIAGASAEELEWAIRHSINNIDNLVKKYQPNDSEFKYSLEGNKTAERIRGHEEKMFVNDQIAERIRDLKEKKFTNAQIAEVMDIPESSVRTLLKKVDEDNG